VAFVYFVLIDPGFRYRLRLKKMEFFDRLLRHNSIFPYLIT